ncbi:acyltransferase family protein [Sphingopyxis sp. PET50]|uniref:acyltransferase family protein n=1 Tax=Sphingopyxis sp. PET50 TaxID=2976533 RepID=UPI00391B46A0
MAYGDRGPTARLLSFAPMRFVGDISYSLYLWHWPVMSFWRYQRGVVLAPWEMAATIGLSFALAIASWRWVEQPFLRRYRAGPAPRVVAAGAAAAVGVAVIAAVAAHFAPALRPLDPRLAPIVETAAYPRSAMLREQFGVGRCHVTVESPVFRAERCLSPVAGRPNVLLLGDSHAAQLSQALRERIGSRGHLLQATASGCRPILPYAGEPRCTRIMRLAVEGPVAAGGVDHVVLAAHWRSDELPGVRAMVEALRARGIGVTVLGPVMRYEEDLPRVIARAMANNDPAMVARTGDPARKPLDRALARAVAGTGAVYVSMLDLECPRGKCPVLAPDGQPFHFDTTHFTLAGSRVMVERLPPAALP